MALPKVTALPLSSLSAATSTAAYDGLVLVFSKLNRVLNHPTNAYFSKTVAPAIKNYLSIDPKAEQSGVSVVFAGPETPGSRIVLSPLAGLFGDVDDSRRYKDAVTAAMSRSKSLGIKRPLLYIDAPLDTTGAVPNKYSKYLEVSLCAALASYYEPLQARENAGTDIEGLESLGVIVPDESMTDIEKRIQFASAIEQGRRLAKDVGGSDPERMTPLRSAEYIQAAFANHPNIRVSVLKDAATIAKEYPCLHAVARASLAVERHHPCVVRLEYTSPTPSAVKENLFLVGKGVTYDTGGADLKVGGVMRGMSRDKCGAAATAGFMKTVALLSPQHLNITATLAMVRNSIGPDAYVSDEIIQARSGVRLLVGNTDAEGRMAMVDLLCKAKEEALALPNSSTARLFTTATLTGHVIRAFGPGYAATLSNGPATSANISTRIATAGELIADPFEISTLRREDFEFVAPGDLSHNVIQANEKPSTLTSRGHQFPAAFMSIASGLKSHGIDSDKPLCYTHLDIAGAAEEGGRGLGLGKVTGAPVAALAATFLKD